VRRRHRPRDVTDMRQRARRAVHRITERHWQRYRQRVRCDTGS
jgi:hypothetical protein